MRYIIQYTRSLERYGNLVVWDEAEQGLLSGPVYSHGTLHKGIPMTKAEAEIFQEMERMGLTKNIEPGRIFLIERD